MSQYLCHDFKTPRTDMSRRLPGSMRVVPIFFYAVALATAFFVFNDMRALQQAEQDRLAALARKDEYIAAKATLDSEKTTIDAELFRAEAVAKWVEGTRVLQPVTVAIARAVPLETNITELNLERSADLPAQVSMLVRLSNSTLAEVAKIESSVNRLNYRSFSPSQAKQGDLIEFRSMLVWQEH